MRLPLRQAVENLLDDDSDWTGKIFSDGWVDAPETIETTEPATGDVLGTAGVGERRVGRCGRRSRRRRRNASGRRCRSAERVAVVRRAAELLERTAPRSSGWLIRESGSIPPKADA